jgi:hypothetical protein
MISLRKNRDLCKKKPLIPILTPFGHSADICDKDEAKGNVALDELLDCMEENNNEYLEDPKS